MTDSATNTEPDLRTDALRCAVLALLWCGLIAAMVLPFGFYFGVDGYFHVTVAEKMAEHGLLLNKFPWVTCSVWVDNFFDKEWLFHVILTAFLPFGRIAAGKVAIIFFNLLVVVAMWSFMRSLKFKNPFWWLMAVPILSCSWMWQRLTLCRPHLFSIAVLMLCLTFLFKRRPILLGLGMLVYALSYTGHWQLLGLTFAFDVAYLLMNEDGAFRKRRTWFLPMTVAALVGMLVGELVHPSFPANIKGLWMQNILILKEYWKGGNEVLFASRPAEMRRLPLSRFLRDFAVILVLLLCVPIHLVRSRKLKMDRDLWMLGAYSGLYLLMTFKSARFVEYFAPVAGVFLMTYIHRHGLLQRLPQRAVQSLVLVLAVFGIVWIGLFVKKKGGTMAYLNNKPHYAECTAFLRQRLEPGEVVYSMYWSDNPQLFFGAPEQRYLVFLDPFFMYAHDPERFRLWNELRTSFPDNAVSILRDTFNARAVFIRRSYDEEGRPVRLKFEKLLEDQLGPPAFVSSRKHLVFLIPSE